MFPQNQFRDKTFFNKFTSIERSNFQLIIGQTQTTLGFSHN